MQRIGLLFGASILASLNWLLLDARAQTPTQQQSNVPYAPNQLPQQGIGPPPKVGPPVAFKSKDGKIKGWKVRIPGNRSLATPAVVDGRIFVSGGFGSHEVYAFDAKTGKQDWLYRTTDDGPTAVVVKDGYVAFNTESCEIEILTVDGKRLWKKWLGDPLMSMPAIADGKVYVSYPNSRGDKKHYLACFQLKTGQMVWKQPLAGEIITAPVIVDDRVYLATLEGTVYCFAHNRGHLVWKEKKNATSAPLVCGANCYFSRREAITTKKGERTVRQQTERVATRGVVQSATIRLTQLENRKADYLDYSKRRFRSALEQSQKKADASVGFDGNKGDAKISQSMSNLARGNVSGVWSYQGSRPLVHQGKLYAAMGDLLQCMDLKSNKVLWKQKINKEKDQKKEVLENVLTPPVIINGKMFLCSVHGEVMCMSLAKGEKLWSVNVGEPILFQPTVANGRVYVSTNRGHLICLETGDPKDHGWLMWGGNAAHNGLQK